MNYAFIKDNRCINIAIFNNIEEVNGFKGAMVADGVIDDLIEATNEIRIGSVLVDGVWVSEDLNVESPTIESSFEELQIEQNVDFDYRLSLLEMGLV